MSAIGMGIFLVREGFMGFEPLELYIPESYANNFPFF